MQDEELYCTGCGRAVDAAEAERVFRDVFQRMLAMPFWQHPTGTGFGCRYQDIFRRYGAQTFTQIGQGLYDAGYRTVFDLQRASDDELLKIRGIGPATLRDIRRGLDEMREDFVWSLTGYSLR